MSVTLILILLAVLCGFYVAWNIGANDVANAVGTSVGSGALTLKQAVLIAAIFEFAGAFLLGGGVSETIESGIVNPGIFSHDKADYVYGMLASLLATGMWLQTASFFGWPVSTTHSIVGAVLGFGLVLGGFDAIYWGQIGSIAASWVTSPLLGGALAYLIFSIIRRKILYHHNPILAAKRLTPYLVFVIFFVLSMIILFGGLSNLDMHLNIFNVFLIACGLGLVCGVVSYLLVKRIREPKVPIRQHNLDVEIGLKKAQKHLRRVEVASLGVMQDKVHALLDEVHALSEKIETPEVKSDDYVVVERIFIYLQIIIACFMAFAHGSNDVANAIGPLSAIFNVLQGNAILGQSVPIWLLLLGGVGIIVGLATWGWRVIETVGRKITELTPSRGFAAGFGAALTIVLASKLGLPISTTHVLVGAVLGVGFARGIGAINLNTIRDIVISWVVTVPAGAVLSVFFFWVLRMVFAGHL
ncbi:MAG: Low-affinity inorganic phosphate transporter 1 [Chlamydiales bacterium]|nr:Low-affinity inorganic phosphate transporter 1 [Chlamydiales bacterium]